jgi:TRAP-type C4-dicarboxylate transport system permease small subunit
MRNEKFSNGIRIVAGGYLIYLAYQLIQGVITGENDSPALGIGGGVLFIAAGAAFIVLSIRSMIRLSAEGQSEEQNGEPAEEQEKTIETTEEKIPAIEEQESAQEEKTEEAESVQAEAAEKEEQIM